MPATDPSPSLPNIVLKDKKVPAEVLALIPLDTMAKYQVAAFEVNATQLKLAIVYPEQLKQGFYAVLEGIGAQIGKKIELYKTDPTSMQQFIKRYKAALAAPVPAPAPPLFKLGKVVSFAYLKKVPPAYAASHRLLCVDFQAPSSFWFLTDEPSEKRVRASLPFIEKRNNIVAHLLVAKPGEVDDLLSYYASLVEKERTEERQEEEKRQKEEHEEEIEHYIRPATVTIVAPEVHVAQGVVMPDLNGGIVSKQEEKTGLAGIIQRVTQSFSMEEDESPGLARALQPQAVPAAPAAPVPPASPSAPVPAPAPAAPASSPAPAAGGAPLVASSVSISAAPPAAPVPPPAAPAPAAAPLAAPAAPPPPGDDGEIGKLLEKPIETQDELKEVLRKGSIPKIVAAVVSFAIHQKASDIHIESFADEVRVRYRIDGELADIVKMPPDVHSAVVSRIKILSRLRLDETRVPQDGRFDVNFNNAQVDLRVSVLPTVHGEKVVMRILDKSKGVSSLEELGINGMAYQSLNAAIKKPFGIVLATGPTGSGKSTTLYSVLNRIATSNVNVITLEDPVEYEMKGINQSQIRPKIGFTFAEGLRSILRQDPNIIMVGEIRDGETANMATQAALTGHLVLSTLHTNDAAGAIPRLTNMGIEPFLITSSLNAVMGQRLVRKICPHCKSIVSMPPSIMEQISKDIEDIAAINPLDAARITRPFKFYQGTGCKECGGEGYRGRLGIYEVLTMSEAIESLTLKAASGTDIGNQARKEGMITMYQDGLLKILAGVTTLDEVLRVTANK